MDRQTWLGLRGVSLILGSFVWLATATCYAQTDGFEGVLHTRESIYPSATLNSLEEGAILFSTPAEKAESSGDPEARKLRIDLDRLVRFGCENRSLDQPAVCLVDDSWISGTLQFRQGEKLRIGNDWLEIPDVDLRSVQSVVLEPPRTVLGWTKLEKELQETTGGEDQVWLRNGQRLSGIARFDRVDQELGYVKRLKIDVGGREVDLLLSEIRAIVFSPALRTKTGKPGVCLFLEDGTRLNLSSLEKTARKFRFSLPAGMEVTSFDEPDSFSEAIIGMVNQKQSENFLGDLKAANYRYQNEGSLVWPLGVNEDVRGRVLRTADGVVGRGIAMHATARAAYRLTEKHRRFLAEVRLARPESKALQRLGSVRCSVLVVKERKLETLATFELSRDDGRQNTEYLNLNLKGADLLVLLVESDTLGNFADEVHWLDARLVNAN